MVQKVLEIKEQLESDSAREAKEEWTAHTDPATGRMYYFNSVKRESRWAGGSSGADLSELST